MTGKSTKHDDDALREALLAGDPAAGDDTLKASEENAIRGRLAHRPPEVAASAAASRAGWWRAAFAVGVVVALLVVMWNRQAQDTATKMEPLPPANPVPAASPSPIWAPLPAPPAAGLRVERPAKADARNILQSGKERAPSAPAQTVRMITRGGTRIVWSVNPGARF